MITLNAFVVALLMQVSVVGDKLLIHEGDRPTNRMVTYQASCGVTSYKVSAKLGVAVEKSILSVSVNATTYHPLLMGKAPGDVSNAVIDGCEPDRAQVRLEVVTFAPRPTLHMFYFWIDRHGNASPVVER